MDGSGLDQIDGFKKFCESGLDRIQLLRIRIGLGLKNFTVRSSLAHIWEKQICLTIQQRQSSVKWFQSLLLPPCGSFNSKIFEGFFNIRGRLVAVR